MADQTCPQCGQTVKAAALLCRYCKYEFNPTAVAALGGRPAELETTSKEEAGSPPATTASQQAVQRPTTSTIESTVSVDNPEATVTPVRRGRTIKILVVVAVVCGLAAAFIADGFMRAEAFSEILEIAEATEPTAYYPAAVAQDRFYACFTESEWSSLTPEATRRLLRGIHRDHEETISRLQQAQVRFDDVGVVPWHRGIDQARAALRAHQSIWIDRLQAQRDALEPALDSLIQQELASAAVLYYDLLVAETPEISATWQEADAAYRAAKPLFADSDTETRIDQVFSESTSRTAQICNP